MFGENALYGTKKVVSDAKGRIVLPAFTNACEGDVVIIKVPNVKGFNYEVISLKEFNAKVSFYDSLIDLEIDDVKRNKLIQMKYNLCNSVLSSPTVTTQNRIVGLDKNKVYKVIGFRNSILFQEIESRGKVR